MVCLLIILMKRTRGLLMSYLPGGMDEFTPINSEYYHGGGYYDQPLIMPLQPQQQQQGYFPTQQGRRSAVCCYM